MASKIIKILIIILVTCAGIVQSSTKCGLFKYYDPHVDNCAPCSELCQLMTVIGTEAQCNAECSDYLTATTCTFEQYFDDVVSNCAFCSELCYLDTAGDCSTKCHNYLKAKNCTEEEYFDVTDMSCSACSELCSRRDQHGDTLPDCFHKCPKYVQKHPPVNIIGGPQQDSSANTGAVSGEAKPLSSLSMHPGYYVAIAVGLAAIIATSAVAVYWVKGGHFSYARAPATEAAIEENKEIQDGEQLNNQIREDEAPQEELYGSGACHGVQECNPYATSAPCILDLRESEV